MLLLAFVIALSQPNEIYFEQKTVTLTDGQPAGPVLLSRVWFAGKRMRLEAGSVPGTPTLILRFDTGAAYRLTPGERRAVFMPLEELRADSQRDLSTAGDFLGGSANSVQTEPLEGSKVIAGRSCRGFRIRSGSATLDVYVASDAPMGMEAFAEFLEWSGANQALGGLLLEIRKLPGFPMQTRSRVRVLGHVQETLSTVTLLELRPMHASLFEPPPDYELTSSLDKED